MTYRLTVREVTDMAGSILRPNEDGVRLAGRGGFVAFDTQELEALPLDDLAELFARDRGQVRTLAELVDTVERFDAGRGGTVWEVTPKQQCIHHAGLQCGEQRVVCLPRLAQ